MKREDLARSLGLLANNAKLQPAVRTEAKRLTLAIDSRLTSLELALRELQLSVGDETLRGGERIRKRDTSARLSAPRLNSAVLRAKELVRE